MKASQAGFSLVEIMVVVVIIGILSTVVVVNVMNSQEQARVSAAKMEIDSFAKGLDMYKLDNASYPESLDVLVGKYLKVDKIPADPWGSRYAYQVNEGDTNKPYTITSYGADRKSGGEEFNADITNWDTRESN